MVMIANNSYEKRCFYKVSCDMVRKDTHHSVVIIWQTGLISPTTPIGCWWYLPRILG